MMTMMMVRAVDLRLPVCLLRCFESIDMPMMLSTVAAIDDSAMPRSRAYMNIVSQTVSWSISASNCGQ